MAELMAYQPVGWQDAPSEETPIDTDNLNHMDAQIKANADFIDNIGGTVPTQQELLDLKMLGWTVPKECPIQNYVDDNGGFYQRVGRVDMGDLVWTYQPTATRFTTNSLVNDIEKAYDFRNVYTSKYESNTAPIANYEIDKTICPYSNGAIFLKDFSFTDGTALKNANKGNYLYYKLATEILIPIDGNEATTKIPTYKKGDVYSFNTLFVASACGGGNGTKLLYSIPIPKSAKGLTPTLVVSLMTKVDGWVNLTPTLNELSDANSINENYISFASTFANSVGTNNTSTMIRISGSITFN